MLYRIAGQYKTSYEADHALFPVRQDAWLLYAILALAYVVLPAFADDFVFQALLIPVLIYSLAALGLNLLTGYAGQLSLGTGAFMGVGAYACFKLVTIFPDLNLILAIFLSGFFSAAVGLAFGLPSLRIKGFYLAIATLAAQFFLVWLFEKWAWLYNYASSGAIQVPNHKVFGVYVAGPNASSLTQYYVVLVIVTADHARRHQRHPRPYRSDLEGGARHGHCRRTCRHQPDEGQTFRFRGVFLRRRRRRRAVRVPVARRGGAQPVRHPAVVPDPVHRHYRRIGLGARQFPWRDPDRRHAGAAQHRSRCARMPISSAVVEQLNVMSIGALIILFLIVEPLGLARFWAIIREKLILWPFPH